jgi:hypothetical protein
MPVNLGAEHDATSPSAYSLRPIESVVGKTCPLTNTFPDVFNGTEEVTVLQVYRPRTAEREQRQHAARGQGVRASEKKRTCIHRLQGRGKFSHAFRGDLFTLPVVHGGL